MVQKALNALSKFVIMKSKQRSANTNRKSNTIDHSTKEKQEKAATHHSNDVYF